MWRGTGRAQLCCQTLGSEWPRVQILHTGTRPPRTPTHTKPVAMRLSGKGVDRAAQEVRGEAVRKLADDTSFGKSRKGPLNSRGEQTLTHLGTC